MLPFKEPIVLSGGDRVPLSLKPRDLAVIQAAAKANPRCVVALVGGSVYTMEELSYTTYAYGNLKVAMPTVSPDGRVDVTVDVTNTGSRGGEESRSGRSSP
jgi:hypothetical protein